MEKQDGKWYALFILLMMIVLLFGAFLMIKGAAEPPKVYHGLFAQGIRTMEMITHG